jgi:hypothetical protein
MELSLPRFPAAARRASLLAVALALLVPLVAPAGAAEEQFATVHRLRGEVRLSAGAAERALRIGDTVRVGDKVAAAATGEAVLKTADSGMVAVRPGAQFVVREYSARGDAGDNQALQLITGSLRVISGWIARLNRSGHKVHTPSATIGIRGTDHEPYVLTADLLAPGSTTPYKAGTYDKVNRGGTVLSASGTDLEIDPGKVGFVRAGAKPYRSRALMTLLLPVLLDKIPEFYVPGEFDAELDKYAEVADREAQKDLERLRKSAPPAPPTPAAAAPVPVPAKDAAAKDAAAKAAAPAAGAVPATPAAPAVSAPLPPGCEPVAVARTWLATLDEAILRKDIRTILGVFAPDIEVKATVRAKDGGTATVDFDRDELVKSTLAAVSQLEGYRHRRISVEAGLAADATACERLRVKSVVIEQGRLAGKPYRFESVESYVLERRDGEWVAIRAETTQR